MVPSGLEIITDNRDSLQNHNSVLQHFDVCGSFSESAYNHGDANGDCTLSNAHCVLSNANDLDLPCDNLYVQHPSTPLELRLAIHLYIKMIFFFFTRIDSKGVRLRRPPVSIFLFSWGGDPLFWASISVVKLVTSDSINTN